MVERSLAKAEVAGSSPVSRSNLQVWCSGNTLAFQAEITGSNPVTCSILKSSYAPLAQLVEHLTLNQGVQGSSP